jgi:hypothetical protein
VLPDLQPTRDFLSDNGNVVLLNYTWYFDMLMH